MRPESAEWRRSSGRQGGERNEAEKSSGRECGRDWTSAIGVLDVLCGRLASRVRWRLQCLKLLLLVREWREEEETWCKRRKEGRELVGRLNLRIAAAQHHSIAATPPPSLPSLPTSVDESLAASAGQQ